MGNCPVVYDILVLITLRVLQRAGWRLKWAGWGWMELGGGWNELGEGGWSWVEVDARFSNTHVVKWKPWNYAKTYHCKFSALTKISQKFDLGKQFNLMIRLQNVLKASLRDVLKMSWKRLQDVLIKVNMFLYVFEDVFIKTSIC